MWNIDSLVQALDENRIAEQVGRAHDDARIRFHLDRSTVDSWPEFESVMEAYYSYHFSACVSAGGKIDPRDARSRAKKIVEREWRRRRGDIAAAYAAAHDGRDGGLRGVLDTLADGMKAEAVENYVTYCFDSIVPPVEFESMVQIIRELFSVLGPHLAGQVDLNRPERYARNYREVIEGYVEGLRQTSSIFRRL